MARVVVKPAGSSRRVMRDLANSSEIAAQLEPLARAVYSAARGDPNERYVSFLFIRQHRSRGPLGRVSWRVGCEVPELGRRVEAERGTLARALGGAGV